MTRARGGDARVRRLLVSHALAAIAMSLPWPLLLVLVWERVGDSEHGPLLVGFTAAARMLPYVLLSWATGSLGDRFRRDRVLRATLVSRTVLLGVVALAVSQGWLLIAVLAATAAVTCGTPAYPLLAAAIPQLAGGARRRATDTLVTIEVGAFVVGPALGGLLLAEATRPWLGPLAVALGAAGLVLVLGVSIPAPVPDAGRPASPRDLPALVWASPNLLAALGVVALLNLTAGAASLVLLPMSESVWDAGARGFGVATGWLGLGALGAPLLWWIRGSATRRRRGGLALLVLALLAVAMAPDLGWALAPLALAGAATVQVESSVTEVIQDGVPDAHRAGVLGLGDSVIVGASLVGSLCAPWLASVVGPRLLLILLALVGVAAIAVPRGHRVRRSAGRSPAVGATMRYGPTRATRAAGPPQGALPRRSQFRGDPAAGER